MLPKPCSGADEGGRQGRPWVRWEHVLPDRHGMLQSTQDQHLMEGDHEVEGYQLFWVLVET